MSEAMTVALTLAVLLGAYLLGRAHAGEKHRHHLEAMLHTLQHVSTDRDRLLRQQGIAILDQRRKARQ